MKTTILTILLLFSGILIAQNDTLIVANNYKFKIGVKGMGEKSLGGVTTNYVFNYGLQTIIKIGKKRSSIESGLYYYKRTNSFSYRFEIYSNYTINYELTYLHIPIKYRWDSRFFYYTIGVYGEYFIHRNVEIPENAFKSPVESNRLLNIGFISSIGIEKQISPQKINVFLELGGSINYSTLYNFENFLGGTSLFARNYGIALGINYKF